MGLKMFMDRNGVKDIDDALVSSIDAAQGIVKLSLAPPVVPPAAASVPIPLIPGAFSSVVGASVMARTGAKPSDIIGLVAPGVGLLSRFEIDVNLLIVPLLLTGAISLNLKPVAGPPSPAVPITLVQLATVPIPALNALRFGKSLLEWALSFVEGDPRVAGTITVALP